MKKAAAVLLSNSLTILVDFNFGRHKELAPFKSDIHLGRVDKSSCLPH